MTVIEKTHELGELIKNDERVIKYNEAKTAHDSDSELQALISQFNLERMGMMNEVNKADKDDKKVEEYQKKVQELYQTIMANQTMKAFADASREIEEMITEINNLINFYVTGEEPSGCSGSCSSCSGCH